MKQTTLKTLLFAAATIGMVAPANAKLLKPGYAVHTFGVSPVSGDHNHTVRIYNTTSSDLTPDRHNDDFDFGMSTTTKDDWTIDKIGNVYGIAIDRERNIYVSASANWSPGYVGTGGENGNVPVKFGSLGGAGTVYKLDADDGAATPFANLPQTDANITNEVCQGAGASVSRYTGPGLGNVAYDTFHNQMFVSNFSDGKIYRVDINGTIIESMVASFADITLDGLGDDNKTVKAPYGLAINLDGTKLYYGTMETSYYPKLFSVELKKDGSFSDVIEDQGAKLVTNIKYTQNIGGDAVDNGTWAAYSDLAFTPDGRLMVGVRVGCNSNFATSYNHGGVVYLLKQDGDGKYNTPSDEVPGTGTTFNGAPEGTGSASERTGYDGSDYRYDAGAIPLHPSEDDAGQARLKLGPDDGYGGVAVWQKDFADTDLYATTSDISSKGGVHGFMQFSRDFNITADKKIIENAAGYGSVESSTYVVPSNDEQKYDYKGIGGDVEVLNALPVCIGSYVWMDQDKDGIQNNDDNLSLEGAKLKLFVQKADGGFEPAKDLNGASVNEFETGATGTYRFCNLPEANYKVCATPPVDSATVAYTKTPVQTTSDNNDTQNDSNIIGTSTINGCEYESGMFTVSLNSEPAESDEFKGDRADDENETWGNMTVDFGFVKNEFDLALIKKLNGDENRSIGTNVTFTITVYNQGNVDATGVKVVDYIPEGLILNDSNWTKDGDKATMKNAIDIKAGEHNDVSISFDIDESAYGKTIVNWAEIAEAGNALGLSDRDSTPGDSQCMPDDLNHDNDILNTGGCDDIDPAPIEVAQKDTKAETQENPSENDPESNEPPCDCENQKDAAGAMSTISIILLLIGTLLVATGFLPKEDTE